MPTVRYNLRGWPPGRWFGSMHKRISVLILLTWDISLVVLGKFALPGGVAFSCTDIIRVLEHSSSTNSLCTRSLVGREFTGSPQGDSLSGAALVHHGSD